MYVGRCTVPWVCVDSARDSKQKRALTHPFLLVATSPISSGYTSLRPYSPKSFIQWHADGPIIFHVPTNSNISPESPRFHKAVLLEILLAPSRARLAAWRAVPTAYPARTWQSVGRISTGARCCPWIDGYVGHQALDTGCDTVEKKRTWFEAVAVSRRLTQTVWS